jgi:NAD(P)-dependent dehydrogenase (short-subunit alcohol dehydrogenase family)
MENQNKQLSKERSLKTILIVGSEPGVSTAVAEQFGAKGFSIALVAKNSDRLAAGVAALKANGIAAAAFQADAGKAPSIRSAVANVRAEPGPITIMHWNASGGSEARDPLSAEPAAVLSDLLVSALI